MRKVDDSNMQSKSKKDKKSIVIILVCAIIALVCIIYIINYYATKSNGNEFYESLQETIQTESNLEIPINFENLHETINPDIYAWITIPDTTINYPVLQDKTDNEYYLNNTAENKSGYPGSIYTENFNQKDFSDFNTVIYGHNMGDGTMFGNLKLFRDNEYLKDHPEIIIYTEESILTYQIFAVVTFTDRHILNTYDFSTTEGKVDFLNDVKDVRDFDSIILEDIPVDENSNILTLSTCIKYSPNNRLIVGAVLIDEQR